ncbi:MAG: radical SAM protein [Chitinivibrionia bacterium]|nr:radical SAM protein [Chitinivibrionia bacterium]
MDEKKRLINCHVPTEACNLRCHYCYITLQRKFNAKLAKLEYSPQYIRKALSVQRLGGKCLFNFCADGETLLSDDVIPVMAELLEEGHYIELVTNGTLTKRFDEIIALPSVLLRRLEFKFSYHYLELKRLNIMNAFFDNVTKVRDAGCSFTIEITPNDELIEHIDDIKKICFDKLHALPHLTIARDDRDINIPVLSKYSFDEYKNIWGRAFESDLFDFKSKIFYQKRKEFCYAGEWTLYMNLMSGDVKQCYCGLNLENLYADLEKPIKYFPVGNNCSLAHCYNGHAYLTLGVIPDLNTPTYADMRNRKDTNGKEWLGEEVKYFLSCKLKDANAEYSNILKLYINLKNKIMLFDAIARIKRRLKRIIRRREK